MKKIIFIILSLVSLNALDIPGINEIDSVFKQLSHGNPKNRILEAMYFENGDPNNAVEPDIVKALEIYYEIFQKTYDPISAYKLGIYAWSLKGKKSDKNLTKKLIKLYEKQFKNKDPFYYFSQAYYQNKSFNNDTPLVVIHNAILAGIFAITQHRLNEAKAILLEPEVQQKALALLWLSFLSKQENIAIANLFLDKACQKQNESFSVKQFCNSNQVKVEK